MALIGIITSNKNEEILKKAVIANLQESEKLNNIIIINKENIYNMKNIKFSCIIMNKENNIKEEQKPVLRQILKNTKFLIINSDIYTKLDMAHNLNIAIITFGYNLKATVTASSVNDKKILLCIQRKININSKIIIEPKEIYAQIIGKDVYTTMASNIIKLLFLP